MALIMASDATDHLPILPKLHMAHLALTISTPILLRNNLLILREWMKNGTDAELATTLSGRIAKTITPQKNDIFKNKAVLQRK